MNLLKIICGLILTEVVALATAAAAFIRTTVPIRG